MSRLPQHCPHTAAAAPVQALMPQPHLGALPGAAACDQACKASIEQKESVFVRFCAVAEVVGGVVGGREGEYQMDEGCTKRFASLHRYHSIGESELFGLYTCHPPDRQLIYIHHRVCAIQEASGQGPLQWVARLPQEHRLTQLPACIAGWRVTPHPAVSTVMGIGSHSTVLLGLSSEWRTTEKTQQYDTFIAVVHSHGH